MIEVLLQGMVCLLGLLLITSAPALGQSSSQHERYAPQHYASRLAGAGSAAQGVSGEYIRLSKAESLPLELSTVITLRLKEATLEDALRRIAAAADLELVYGSKKVAVGEKVSLSAEKITAGEALREVLRGTGLRLMKLAGGQLVVVDQKEEGAPQEMGHLKSSRRSKIKAIIPARLTYRRQAQQTGTIMGTVTTAATGEPLPGVNVILEGTQQGAATGAEGQYEISGVEVGTYTLVASFIGYGDETEEGVQVQEGQTTTVDIVMQPEAQGLDEVVVVGYGEQQRKDFTGSVSSISTKAIQETPVTAPDQILQGRLAGVHVTQASTAPGGATSVRIRGTGSLQGGTEPLYVIDGFPVYSGATGSPGGRATPNPLNSINPSDIESIDVLKDASATAIYGARGANGVVLIETKKGQAGETRVNFDSYVGTQRVANEYHLLNASQFAQFANESLISRGLSPVFEDPASFGEGTDWQDLIFQPASTQNYQLSVSGGDESTQYFLSGNFLDQDGVIITSNFKRYSFRGNINKDVSDRLKVGSNFTANRTINTQVPATGHKQGVMQALRNYIPIFGPFDEEGNYVNHDKDPVTELGLPGAVSFENPLAFIRERDSELLTDRVLGNAFAEYQFLEGLSLRVSAGADIVDGTQETYETSKLVFAASGISNATTLRSKRTALLNENVLKYDHMFGEAHDLDLTAGFTWQKEINENQSLEASEFTTDLTKNNDLGSGNPATQGVGSGKGESTLLSWLGRANYVFNGKYLLTLSARADGSSKFGAGNKWGFFPSGALAWRLSEEPFIQGLGLFSNLKARVSYGITGNQEIGTYQSQGRLGTSSYSYGGTPISAFIPTRFANPDLKWETTKQLDIGLDIGFLDQRLRLTADYYRKDTEDLLLFVTLPESSGFFSSFQNAGSLLNAGFELALEADPLTGPLLWSTSANVSTNRNEVTSLGKGERFFGSRGVGYGGNFNTSLVEEGQPIGAFYGYKTDGIFASQEEIEAYGAQPDAQPGGIKFVDTDGDGDIDANDRTVIGNPHPDVIFGWTNDFSYKNFGLNVFLQGVQGADIYNMDLVELENRDIQGNSSLRRFEERWTPENRDATYPRAGLNIPFGTGRRVNDRFIEDGSYLRLKTVTLSYALPASRIGWLQSIGLKNARVYLKGVNLVTLSEYSGPNPDVNTRGQDAISRGIDNGSYPFYRSYIVGINVGF